jgi:HSP20 family protein
LVTQVHPVYKGNAPLSIDNKKKNMVLTRWDPIREMRRLDEAFNRARRTTVESAAETRRWAVPLDVVAEDDKIQVKATLPGIKAEYIDVTVEDDLLTIKAETKEEHEERGDKYPLRERRAGNFYRALSLPDTVDAEKIETTYADGVLTITFLKNEAKKAKPLEVKAA